MRSSSGVMELTVAGTGGKLGGGAAPTPSVNENAATRTRVVLSAELGKVFTLSW